MFKNLLRVGVRLAPVALLPWATNQFDCLFWKSGPTFLRNNLENRAHVQVLVSNAPCEDRSDVIQLSSIQGYAAAVYDGHGGWQLSQLCSEKLLKKLDQFLKVNKQSIKDSDELIKKSIEEAYDAVQKQFLDAATVSYQYGRHLSYQGFGRAARVGSCALICVVHNNKVYCGNVGDSLGLLVRSESPMGFQQINRFLNADNPEQQERLKASFPNQEDIFFCKKPNNTCCYVKKRLQPTRSLGDFSLKYAYFNNPNNLPSQMEYRSPIQNYTGSYINPVPEIKVFELNKSHKSIILASDGLWDMLGKQQVAQVFKNNQIATVPSILIQKSLEKAAEQSKITVQQIKKIKEGKKRNIHDDITIVVLDLQKQVK